MLSLLVLSIIACFFTQTNCDESLKRQNWWDTPATPTPTPATGNWWDTPATPTPTPTPSTGNWWDATPTPTPAPTTGNWWDTPATPTPSTGNWWDTPTPTPTPSTDNWWDTPTPTPTPTPTSGSLSGSGSSNDLERVVLDMHNAERRRYGIAPVTWSASLASTAATFVATSKGCQGHHDTDEVCQGSWSESVSGPHSLEDGSTPQSIANVAEGFFWEIIYFQCQATRSCMPNEICTHYLAAINPKATQVGCAMTNTCGGLVINCRYNTPCFPSFYPEIFSPGEYTCPAGDRNQLLGFNGAEDNVRNEEEFEHNDNDEEYEEYEEDEDRVSLSLFLGIIIPMAIIVVIILGIALYLAVF